MKGHPTGKKYQDVIDEFMGKKKSKMYVYLIIAALLVVGYFMYKNVNEKFTDSMDESYSDNGEAPNLKPGSGECIVALFYADWCPHCVAFKPDFQKAMSQLDGNMYKGDKLRFVLVDCVAFKELASANNVNGYPTVKIFNSKGSKVEYDGDRSFNGLKTYFA
jgi:thiol-disulfide isomerase/thioredoxin